MIGYFGLESYDLPAKYLVPRVPQRMVYLAWIKSLFDQTNDLITKGGFDIGTGANCIYPVLGILKFGWNMSGSEVNEASLNWAINRIVHPNELLKNKIAIRK